jgi:hypothetical protein
MVSEFGYRVVLMRSGRLMRDQFFSPYAYRPDIPIRIRLMLGMGSNAVPVDAPMWANPFTFALRPGACVLMVRTFGITVPLSQNPRDSIARHLRIVPSRFKMRPDFSTYFD